MPRHVLDLRPIIDTDDEVEQAGNVEEEEVDNTNEGNQVQEAPARYPTRNRKPPDWYGKVVPNNL